MRTPTELEEEFVARKLTKLLLMAALRDSGNITKEEEDEFLRELRAEMDEFMRLNKEDASAMEKYE